MQPDLVCEGWVARLSTTHHEFRDPVWMPCADLVGLSRSPHSRAGCPATEQVPVLTQPGSREHLAGSG